MAMSYIPLLLHVLLIGLARRVWRRRGLEWSVFNTAECIVFPFVLLLAWPFAATVIPSGWLPSHKPASDLVAVMIVFLPPLVIFWSWFFWSGLSGKRRT